jgi:aminoglycoside phosphotransferase family enzyme/predicted kinase
MVTEDQSRVVAFLGSPAAHGGAEVERIDTHASIVFLAGGRALKLKRAVRYDYLDYSTIAQRRLMCEAEVRINRRTARALYRGAVAVTSRDDGSLAIGGEGRPVEWLVEMERFDQQALLIHLAEAGRLPLKVMEPLARAIARFHHLADGRVNCGGWDAMGEVIDGNAAGFANDGAGILDPISCARLTRRARFMLDRVGSLLDQRRDRGLVRHCHGDLHLRNIVMQDGEPVLFDAIEFNDDISSVDVLYDVAFLLMDLWRLGLPHHANLLWNRYLAETYDFDGLPLMPLFLSCRAAVVAKTTATTANLERDQERRGQLAATANGYLALAESLLEPAPPQLIGIGGFSGSGKSTLAMDLAPAIGAVPGAIVVRSDVIRKKLCGVDPLQRLGPHAYTDEMSRRVYAALIAHVDHVTRGGYAAIADAVFAREEDREALRHAAALAGVPFVGLWLEAPEPVLMSRIAARADDASDADANVIRGQLAHPQHPGRWHCLDASGTRQQVCDAARAIADTAREQELLRK